MPHNKELPLLGGKAVESCLQDSRALGVFKDLVRTRFTGSKCVRERELVLPRRVQRLFAAAAACYMFGVRAGISTSVRLKWAKKVHQLPPLTEETTGQWWPLAREEIDECYPDLRHVFFPKGSLQISVRRKDAWNAIEEAFRHTWKMFS